MNAPLNRRAGHRPEWLKIRIPGDLDRLPISRLMNDLALNTVCQEARCPNIFECWSAGTATFMILGEICTRRCTFCAVGKGKPFVADADEPRRVAEAVETMGARHVVITMVNRDARPDVFNHNVETVPRLYPAVRPVAKYRRSLDVLRWAHEAGMRTKSSLMLGLGESEEEILATAHDLRDAGVDIFTMGQYLAPTGNHHPVRRYWTPEEFASLGDRARALGFHHVESAPLVRSSYMAHRALHA